MEEREKIESIESMENIDNYEILEKRRNKGFRALLAALLMILAILAGIRAKESDKIENSKVKSKEIPFDEVIDNGYALIENKLCVDSKITKFFEPGTHVFSKRYKYGENGDSRRQIEIPNGYEIFSIQDYIGSLGGNGGHTKGFDVFFINNKPVEAVKSTIITGYDSKGHEQIESGYFEPGVVKEQDLEQTPAIILGL